VCRAHRRGANKGDGETGRKDEKRRRSKEKRKTHRRRSERVLLLAHSRIFFFSQPSTVFTHSSPGLRQSLDMNGILGRGRARRRSTTMGSTTGTMRLSRRRGGRKAHLAVSVDAECVCSLRSQNFTLALRRRASAHGFVLVTSPRISCETASGRVRIHLHSRCFNIRGSNYTHRIRLPSA